MTNSTAALGVALLLVVAATACEGAGPLNDRVRPDAGLEAPVGGLNTPDAESEHPAPPPDAQSEHPAPTPAPADAARTLPPPPPDVCGSFHLRYSGAVGASPSPNDCPDVDCHCVTTYSGPVPTPLHGCVQSVDCAAACASGDQWLVCAVYACVTDSDCGAFSSTKCVVLPGAIEGVCQVAGVGSRCVDAEDCGSGERCIAVEADGTRGCIDPAANDRGHCTQDADCGAGHCALPGASFLGVCSGGEAFASCFSDGDCRAGLHCKNVADSQPGSCSDGADGTPCERDADCQAGVCTSSVCSFGKVDDFCGKNADCQSGFCAFGIRCTDGAVDAPCEHDDQCASGRCAANAAITACTTGARAAKCVDDQDCVSRRCQHRAGADVTSNFGSCD
jgi:hypothetical protein